MGKYRGLSVEQYRGLHEGLVIPAHPLALNQHRELDEVRQRALTRYYLASGAGGVAVGVHTTQFEIREAGLYETVLRLAAEEVEKAELNRPFLKVAGLCGPTDQVLSEAKLAVQLGYEIGLLGMNGLAAWSEEELLDRARQVAEEIPVFGFYLQSSVGGRAFSYRFWREFSEIPGVVAIKMAPFDRYRTLEVVRAVCESSRGNEIALYTGNDDNIVNELLTTFRFNVNGTLVEKKIVGGLLGHWAVWTRRAVELLEEIKKVRNSSVLPAEWLTRNVAVTDCNAAFFDAANGFKGCIAGIHEVLRRQGLLEGIWCLNPNETLSTGQQAEIERIYHDYPGLNDDQFVAANLRQWLQT